MALPAATHELGVPAEPVACVYKCHTTSDNDKRKTHPLMISIASTLFHPGRVSPASASPLTSLISRVRRLQLLSRVRLRQKMFEYEKDDASPAEREKKSGAFRKRFEKQRGSIQTTASLRGSNSAVRFSGDALMTSRCSPPLGRGSPSILYIATHHVMKHDFFAPDLHPRRRI